MAEGKKSVIIYSDLIHTVRKLPREKAGDLLMVILEYINDLDPVIEDPFIDLAFEPIKQQMKRDLKKWEAIKVKRSEAGTASAEAKKVAKEAELLAALLLTNSTSVESVEQNQQEPTNSTVTVNVNDTVSVTVNGTVTGNDKKEDDVDVKETPSSNFPFFTIKNFEDLEFIHGSHYSIYAFRQTNKSCEELSVLKTEFIETQRAISKLSWKDETDAKTHFLNWVKKQPAKTATTSSKPKETTLQKHARRQAERNGTA